MLLLDIKINQKIDILYGKQHKRKGSGVWQLLQNYWKTFRYMANFILSVAALRVMDNISCDCGE